MCGIAGILCSGPEADLSGLGHSWQRLLDHRGPDDHGWLLLSRRGARLGRGPCPAEEAQALFLHLRLSIIDRSDTGWQPMGMPGGSHYLLFNGEIYNYLELRDELEALGHVFRSRSDTEVLLHAYVEWGRRALTRLVGMFALAVVDVCQRKLFLARDFFGIKPLYYTRTPSCFAFASEVKALLDLPGVRRTVNPQRLYEYLRFGRTDHGGDTLFSEIQQVPAAHYLELALDRPGEPCPVPYWRADPGERLEISFPEAAERLRELFLDSVRLHLRSDVPVGAALSGGIDSSAIVAAMRHLQPGLEIHTFSYVADHPSLSEERWATVAAFAAGAVLHTVRPSPEDLAADLDELVYLQDEPFGSTSIYAQNRVFRLARERGIRVMLDGQGADEILGGYQPFAAARLGSLVRQGRWTEAAGFLARASRSPGSGGMRRLLLQTGGLLADPRVKGCALWLAGKELFPPWLKASWFKERGVRPGLPDCKGRREVLREQLRQTLVETSLPMLLRYEDRNSMAYSIESRVPFLTPALVEFVLRLPEEHIIGPDGTSKNVFRRALRGIVPDVLLDRRDKVGFATPEQGWLAALRPWVEKTLIGPAARAVPALDHRRMGSEHEAIFRGRKPFNFRVWRWLNLIRWAERFGVNFGD